MFDSIRNHKKYLMGFLMILIIPAFVLFGVEGYSRFNEGGEVVATVDGQEITKLEWDRAHQNESQRLREAMPALDARLLDSEAARYATLERLVRQRVLATAAQKLNLYTSDRRLAQDLQANETIASLRRPDGTLDVDAYRTLLGRQGLTPEMYEAQVRADLSQRQVVQAIQGTSFATTALANVSLNAFFERREVRVAQFLAQDFAARVTPTEAEIEAFYNSNAPLFQAPEQVDVEYLVLDAAALEQSVVLAEADVRAYYDQNASRLSGSEERRASHILLTVPQGASDADKAAVRERAAALLEQVKGAPKTFADVARAESQDPGSAPGGGDLDFFARGAMVKSFEDAAYALQKGDISDLVETEFGFHIIQLTDIKAPPLKSFEEMRVEIEKDLKRQQAQRLFAESAEAFSNLVYEQPDSLQPAVARFKLNLQEAKGLTRQPAQEAGVLANPSLLEAIFSPESIERKRNTEAIETGSGQLTSARVVLHSPARTLPLAEVRGSVQGRLVAQRSAEMAREEGERKLEAWKAGGDTAGLAAAVTISRDNPQGVLPQVLAAALSADPKALPAWVGVSLGGQGHAVVRVDKVLPREAGDEQRLAQEVQQYTQWWSAAEGQAYYDMLKERFKVRILVPEPADAPVLTR
ncbi:SurA N-terminal domain-containing protein [Hydrogenophaga sp.]|uniref:SurA N-terminal domain-containing protein n=1 Tax=Hydrogenophaga sp. TaxID=1904254 RepID=UPI00271CDCA8|nr:SurA N-terminal domain-containing protein [Hydrogenophaga sp.]MDO8904740.1 SurA N-terminal domain-containing protein [Hydrogenophaga sp.]